MALPGMALVFLLLAYRDRRLWWVLAPLAGATVVLVMVGVEPFGRATRFVDDEWFSIMLERVPYVLLSHWDWRSVAESTLPVVALLIALQIGSAAERRLVRAVLVVAALGLAAAYLGGDLARNVLILNLQSWRALWLVALIGNLWAAVAALRLPAQSMGRQFLLIALACNVVERWMGAPPWCSAPVAVIALVAFLLERQTSGPLSLPLRLLSRGLVAAAIGVLGVVAWAAIPIRTATLGPLGPAVLAVGTIGGLVLMFLHTDRLQKRTRIMSAILAWVLLFAVVAVADQRSDWARFVEEGAAPKDLSAFLVDGDTVYWEGGLSLLWFSLQRPSYYSCDQGSGIMFFRGTAEEYRRRSEALQRLNTARLHHEGGRVCQANERPGENGSARRENLIAACRALPDLDVLVLIHDVPDAPSRQWRAPVPMQVRDRRTFSDHDTFHLFRCVDFR
jgi:hypothetical protein